MSRRRMQLTRFDRSLKTDCHAATQAARATRRPFFSQSRFTICVQDPSTPVPNKVEGRLTASPSPLSTTRSVSCQRSPSSVRRRV